MASILETFYFLFEAKGADSVKRSSDDASRSTDNLTASFNRADAASSALGEHLLASVKSIGVAVASVFAVSTITRGIEEQNEFNVQLLHTSERLQIGVADLAAYGEAVKREGGSFESFSGSLDDINRNIARIAATGQSRLKKVFEDLKIQVTDAPHHARPLLDVLGDLADRFQKMKPGERAGFGSLFMLDPATVLLLAKGREGVAGLVKQMKELGVPTQEDAEKAEELELQIDNLTQVLHEAYTTIASLIVPVLTVVAKGIQTFAAAIAEHRPLITGFFVALGALLVTFAAEAWAAIAPVLVFLATWLLIPAAILAVAAAFALVWDDVQNFLEGNKSVIGELARRWPIVGEVIHGIADAFVTTGHVISKVINGIVGGVEWVITEVEKLLHLLHIASDDQAKQEAAIRKRGGVIGYLNSHEIGDAFDHLGKFLSGRANVDIFGNPLTTAQRANSGMGYAQTYLGIANNHPFNSLTSSAINPGGGGGRSINVPISNITVNTQATDADGIAGAVGDSLQSHISHAINQFDDGVQG